MGASAEFGSKVSKVKLLEWLSGSTSAGRQGPLRASSNFLRNLKRVLRRQEKRKWSRNNVGSRI